MRNGIKASLRSKLVLIFILLLTIPLLVSGYFVYLNYSKDIKEKELQVASQNIDKLSKEYENTIYQIKQLSFDVSYHPQIQNILVDYQPNRFIGPRVEAKYFQDMFGVNRLERCHVFYISIMNMEKQIALSLGTTPKTVSGFDVNSFEKEYKTYWHMPFIEKTYEYGGEEFKLISHFQWIYNKYGNQKIGLVQVDIDTNALSAILSETDFSGYENYLSYQDTIVASNMGNSIGRDISDMLSGQKINTVQKEGKEYYYLENTITSGWKLTSLIPFDAINAKTSAIFEYIIIIAATCLLFAILLMIVPSILITKPIYALVKKMREVEQGNLKTQYQVTTKDEIGVLGESFNKMIDQINSLIKKNKEILVQEQLAESRYLQSQINPHFLYNTLDSIRWTAVKSNDNHTAEQIEMLSNLFRYYYNSKGDFITFQQEVEHVSNYLKIYQFRFRDRLSYSVNIEEEIYDLYTIKFILQPIIENSFVHGLETKADTGHVSIEGFIEGDLVCFLIQDNGVGTDETYIKDLLDPQNDNKGSALNNIQKRIHLKLGKEYGLELHSRLGHGTTVLIRLPIIRQLLLTED